MSFRILVDADSVPVNLRQIILRAACRLELGCVFVADRALPDVRTYIEQDTHAIRQKAREGGETDVLALKALKSAVCMQVVGTGQDSADDRMVEISQKGDLCITHDIPLASRLLEKGCTVIDDRGSEYTADDIKKRLSDRLVNSELRSWGVFSEQQGKMDGRTVKSFADRLDMTLSRMTRENG